MALPHQNKGEEEERKDRLIYYKTFNFVFSCISVCEYSVIIGDNCGCFTECCGDLSWQDITVIVVYLSGVFVTGIMAACVGKKKNLQWYFLVGCQMTWLPVGTSLYVSNIGFEHLATCVINLLVEYDQQLQKNAKHTEELGD